MTQLVVAADQRRAAQCAKREGLRGKWVAVTPDNYEDVLSGLAVSQRDIIWDWDDYHHLAWGSWSLPDDMLDAIRACIHRRQA